MISRRKIVVRQADVAPELAAYAARIATAGGTISAGSLTAVGDFIAACKAASLWNQLVDVGVFAGNQLAASLVKLKYPTGVISSLTNHSFVGGDYTEATGLNGNGTTKYLQTGINMQDHVNSAYGAMGVYTRGAALSDEQRVALGDDNAWLGADSGQTDWNDRMEFDFGLTGTPIDFGSGAAGFYAGVVEQPEQLLRAYRNGVLIGVGETAGESNDFEHYVFAQQVSDAPENFWSGRISFYFYAQWLAAADIANLYTAVQALQTKLGRNV